MANQSTRGTIWCAAIGLGMCAFGGLLLLAVSRSPDAAELSGLGWFLLVIGSPLFFIAILVELFDIGSRVRNIETTLSLSSHLGQPASSKRASPPAA